MRWAVVSWNLFIKSAWREMRKAGVPFVAQQELVLYYKGEALNRTYKPDFICFGKIIVEKLLRNSATSIGRRFTIISRLPGMNWHFLSTLAITPRLKSKGSSYETFSVLRVFRG